MPTGKPRSGESRPVRAVLDTNVMISGILHHGRAREVIEAAVEGRLTVVTSQALVSEFSSVISREKFGLSGEEQDRLVRLVLSLAEVVRVRSRFRVVKDDPSDDAVLRAAVDGKVGFIISGDQHILSLRRFRGVRILGVAEALEMLETREAMGLTEKSLADFLNGEPDIYSEKDVKG